MQVRNNYTPDVLDCLANLSSDEVFTPPIIVNQMLDQLPQEIFKSKDTTFLDPFTKSGVFLREITKRLLEGQIPNYKQTADEIERITKEAIQDSVRNGQLDLEDEEYETKARDVGNAAIKKHPEANKYLNFEIDLQDALDHILTKQVFGIAITELTSQLARRSLYCSKDASGHYSVCSAFGVNGEGNIRFVPMKHKWNKVMNKNGTFPKGTVCAYCGASVESLDRPDEFETHAYEFIHVNKPEEIFNMEFTVVCGNPPYQLETGGGTSEKKSATQAKPIYHQFFEQAKRLNPKYITMITPARWYNGGMGLENFRHSMLNDGHITTLVDYNNSKDCFQGVDIAGGICYFLWERDHSNRECTIINKMGDRQVIAQRPLNEFGDMFIRSNESIDIIKKVTEQVDEFWVDNVSTIDTFGIPSKEKGHKTKQDGDFILITSSGYNDQTQNYISPDLIKKNKDLVDKYKVKISIMVPQGGEVGIKPENGYRSMSTPQILPPGTVDSFSYLNIGFFDSEDEAINFVSFVSSKFVRFLMRTTYSSVHISKNNFCFVPKLSMNQKWDDKLLYSYFNLSNEEIELIEKTMRPMEL